MTATERRWRGGEAVEAGSGAARSYLANRVALDPIKQQNNEVIKPTEHCAAQYFGRYLGENPRFLFSVFFACARGARASVRVP